MLSAPHWGKFTRLPRSAHTHEGFVTRACVSGKSRVDLRAKRLICHRVFLSHAPTQRPCSRQPASAPPPAFRPTTLNLLHIVCTPVILDPCAAVISRSGSHTNTHTPSWRTRPLGRVSADLNPDIARFEAVCYNG